MLYLEVATELRSRIKNGDYAARGALDSELQLSKQFGVSRVTVRRALELLREEGLVDSRHGAGWFLNLAPIPQGLTRFVPVERALAQAGARPSRRVLAFEFGPAPESVAKDLGLADGDEVLHVLRLNLADGDPFARVSVWLPRALGDQVTRAEAEQAIFYDLLPQLGVELGRAHQIITAEPADELDEELFGLRAGMPMIVCHRRTFNVDGQPVISSWHRYPAHRTAFEVDFPNVEGLRH